MKAHLLFPAADFDWERPILWNAEALKADLGLPVIFGAMANGDEHLADVAEKVILASADPDAAGVGYRQGVLAEALERPQVVRELYSVTLTALEIGRRHWFGSLVHYPDWVLSKSVELMTSFLDTLRQLRRIADAEGGRYRSPGWTQFFRMLRAELSDAFFRRAADQLRTLRFTHGMLLSARLGEANKATDYRLHYPPAWLRPPWWRRLRNWLFPPAPPPFSFDVHPRDESGIQALEELKKRGIAAVAESLAQATDHIVAFFKMLRQELAFYIGCINLRDALQARGCAVSAPAIGAACAGLSFKGLYDAALALSTRRPVVASDLEAGDKTLIFVSGANQGGKSTFLRGVALAELMARCGLFAPATAYAASLGGRLFTHFKREEDVAMESGKLDEELARLSRIVDHLTPGSTIFLNESFAATNEREGSEIGRQVICALRRRDVRVVCVTHLYDLVRGFYDARRADALFLQPERRANGERTFRVIAGAPTATSFGEDLYRDVFGAPLEPMARQAARTP